jgi:hypothetical protein
MVVRECYYDLGEDMEINGEGDYGLLSRDVQN